MNREFERLNRALAKYINGIPLDQEIDIEWLLKIVEVLLNKQYSEAILIEFLKSKGFTKFNRKIEEPTAEKETTSTATIEDDDDDEDFDPNEFLETNKDTIKNTKLSSSRNFEENTILIKQYQQRPDDQTLAEIMTINMGLIEKIAYRYGKSYRHNLDYEDLVSIGKLGLMKAINKFDPSMGYQFSTYATWWIRQAITRAIMDEGTTIRIPVHMYEQIARMIRVENECVNENNKVDIDWVCEHLDMTKEKYDELKKIDYTMLGLASLDSIISVEDDDTSIIDFIAYSPHEAMSPQIAEFMDPTERILYKDLKNILLSMLNTFTDREQKIIKLRFGFDNGQAKTLEEVGKVFGVTRERIRQIEVKVIRRLHRRLVMRHLKYKDLVPQ